METTVSCGPCGEPDATVLPLVQGEGDLTGTVRGGTLQAAQPLSLRVPTCYYCSSRYKQNNES